MKIQNKPKAICLHKAGWNGHHHNWNDKVDWTVDTIRDFHVNVRGFSDIGYHYIVLKDGTVVPARDVKYAPAHAVGHNDAVIAICIIGEFTREEPTDAQINSLKILLVKLCKEFDIDTTMHHIFTHADYRDPPGNRYCPGKYLHRKVPEISNWVRNAIKKGVS